MWKTVHVQSVFSELLKPRERGFGGSGQEQAMRCFSHCFTLSTPFEPQCPGEEPLGNMEQCGLLQRKEAPKGVEGDLHSPGCPHCVLNFTPYYVFGPLKR